MLEYQFRSFISWPDPGITRTVVPECLRKTFGNEIAGTVDCFEIRTERVHLIPEHVAYLFRNTSTLKLGNTLLLSRYNG